MTKLSAPPDVHELTVEKHRSRNRLTGAYEADAAIEALSGAMRQARSSAEQIIALVDAVQKDETLTPAARAMRIRGTAIKLAERATQGLDAARTKAQQELQALEHTIAIPQPRDMLEAEQHREIRVRFLALPQKDRVDALSNAMAQDREHIVHAILGDPFLSDLEPAEHAMRLAQWQAKRHPVETERRDRLSKSLQATERGGATFLKFVEEQVSSPGQEMAEANRQRAEEMIAAARAE